MAVGYFEHNGKYCAIGALKKSASRLGVRTYGNAYGQAYRRANKVAGGSIMTFNDGQIYKKNGKERVIAKLKAAKTIK